MRVALSTWGGRGDVEPLVALAVELRQLGAEVVVCASPDDDFLERMAPFGVTFVGVGPATKELMQAQPRPSIPATAARINAAQFADLAPALADCDVLVATGALPAQAGAVSVAEQLGLPVVPVTFVQLTLPSPTRPPMAYPGHPLPEGVTDNAALWDFDVAATDALFRDALNAARTASGMAPVEHVRDVAIGPRPWVATDPVLDPWTGVPGLDVVQTGSWTLLDDRPLPGDLEAFLDAGDPPVSVGFGSMAMHEATDVAEVALAAIRAHGRRAVLLRGWADLAPSEVADDCLVVGEVNHQALLRRCAAVVHHGGQGTTFTATRAGTPQVVVPQLADQPYWASRVAALGVGVAHDGPVPTRASLTAALGSALAPETVARAAEVAPLIRTDGAAVAARLLVELGVR